jgi:hypothetical protein
MVGFYELDYFSLTKIRWVGLIMSNHRLLLLYKSTIVRHAEQITHARTNIHMVWFFGYVTSNLLGPVLVFLEVTSATRRGHAIL